MTLEKIIELVLKLISQLCPNANPAEIAQQLQNPSPFNKMRLEVAIRRELGIKPLAWMRVRHEFMSEIYGGQHMMADEETIEAILKDRQ